MQTKPPRFVTLRIAPPRVRWRPAELDTASARRLGGRLMQFAVLGLGVGCSPIQEVKKEEARLTFPPMTQQVSLRLSRTESIDVRLLEITPPVSSTARMSEKDYAARYEWSMTIYCGADSLKEARIIAERAPGTLSYWRIPWPADCNKNRNEVHLTIEANYLRCVNPNIQYIGQNFEPGMMLQVDMICKESVAQDAAKKSSEKSERKK